MPEGSLGSGLALAFPFAAALRAVLLDVVGAGFRAPRPAAM